MEEESAAADLINGRLESKEKQVARVKARKRSFAARPPEIDLIYVGPTGEEFVPGTVGGVDVKVHEALLGRFEFRKSNIQILALRLEQRILRHDDQRPVHFLQTVFKHGAVMLVENVSSNMDSPVCIDAEDVAVEGRVVNPTKREPVGDLRESALILVRNDMRSIQERPMTEPAHTAMTVVSSDDQLAKSPLVQSRFHCAHGVSPLDLELRRGGF
jgi:hypothetical protein